MIMITFALRTALPWPLFGQQTVQHRALLLFTHHIAILLTEEGEEKNVLGHAFRTICFLNVFSKTENTESHSVKKKFF